MTIGFDLCKIGLYALARIICAGNKFTTQVGSNLQWTNDLQHKSDDLRIENDSEFLQNRNPIKRKSD